MKGGLVLAGKPLYQILLLGLVIIYVVYGLIRRILMKKKRRIGLVAGVILGVGALGMWKWALRDMPKVDELLNKQSEITTRIYDRNGILLYKIYKDKNRTPVRLTEVPMEMRLATLAAEDAEFYNHPGFSIRGISRAIIKYLREDTLTGGSTITQQLVKNRLLTPERTIKRKIRELVLAVGVERRLTKDKILEMYLNEVGYGGTAYGVREAARVYFDKEVTNLTLAESALLAGLPKSPTRYSPFGANPELALERQEEILNLMVINKYISSEQAERAKTEKMVFAQNKTEIKAPHFVMYVREILAEKYGEEMVEKGGLRVVTTLDTRIQTLAEEIVKNEVEKLVNLKVTNGAALVLDTKTGEILAMVGSRDYFDTAHDGNVNVLTRLRQPGSSIKIVNYAYALTNGYTAATILKDAPIVFRVSGSPPYSPSNYDGRFRGNLSLRSALAESRNVPAVRVLATYGVEKMVEQGRTMGITTWKDPTQYGLSLTLGGGDVKLIDLARAYATVANYGKKPKISSISAITDEKGKPRYIKENNGENGSEAVDPRVAFILIDILRDNKARTPAFGANSALVIPGHAEVAVKTGTSNNLRDNVTVGFNQDFLVATWVGNNDNSPMSRVASGVTGASPIWQKIMIALLEGRENHDWEVPAGLVQREICGLTGTLPCQGCPTVKEWFLEENQPTKHCEAAWFEKKEEEGKKEKEKPEERIL